jgi:hypothetical protein
MLRKVTTRDELLARHVEQVRGRIDARVPPSWHAVRDGPVLHAVAAPVRQFVFTHGLADVSVAELDALITRVLERAAGAAVQWKTYGHDRPDLAERLRLAGFVPEEEQTVVVGPATELATAGAPPDGVAIRATADPADLHRIAAMESEVWGLDLSSLADDLRKRIESAPADTVVLVAEAAGEVVSAAWVSVLRGTEFAALWGGSTVERHRGRGIYRALVARRATEAVSRGVRYLTVDASKDSGPILERLGLLAIDTTVPWAWTPKTA